MSAPKNDGGPLERKLLSAAYYALYALCCQAEAPAVASAFEVAARQALRQAEALYALARRRDGRAFAPADALAHAAQRELADTTVLLPRAEQALLRRQRPEEARVVALLAEMARVRNQRFCALLDAAVAPPEAGPRGYACARCGYEVVADAPPGACPVCGAKGGF